jgi:hypothetical protein
VLIGVGEMDGQPSSGRILLTGGETQPVCFALATTSGGRGAAGQASTIATSLTEGTGSPQPVSTAVTGVGAPQPSSTLTCDVDGTAFQPVSMSALNVDGPHPTSTFGSAWPSYDGLTGAGAAHESGDAEDSLAEETSPQPVRTGVRISGVCAFGQAVPAQTVVSGRS